MIAHPDRPLYRLAEFPPHDIDDAKRMAVEQRFGQCSTPEELLEALPKAVPLDRGNRLTKLKEGVYSFDVPLLKSIPMMNWNQLYNIKANYKGEKPEEMLVGTGAASSRSGAAALAALPEVEM